MKRDWGGRRERVVGPNQIMKSRSTGRIPFALLANGPTALFSLIGHSRKQHQLLGLHTCRRCQQKLIEIIFRSS